MKKLLLTLLGALIGLPAFARDFTFTYEGQTITYTVIDENAKTCKTKERVMPEPDFSVSGDLILPSHPKDEDIEFTLTQISDDAFGNCSGLTSVSIPNSVTSIGNYAFYNCSSLTSISIPNSVTSIGVSAFEKCSGLTSISIPNSVNSIVQGAFWGCTGLTSVSIPNSINSISYGAFYNCSSLTSISIPNSVTSIGDSAFFNCSGLTSISIPNSVTSIGFYAFQYCYNLISLTIPESVTSIGSDAFSFCHELKKVAYPNIFSLESLGISSGYNTIIYNLSYDPAEVNITDDGCVYSKDGKSLIFVPANLSAFSIPDGVTTICKDSFAWSSIDHLTIPASIEEVEENAFWIGYPMVSPISETTFIDWDKWYNNVKLGNLCSNPYRNGGAFVGGIPVPAPKLTEGMTEIPDFKNPGITPYEGELGLPSTIKKIGAYAFYNNKEIYNIFLPNGLEEIGEAAFYNCELLENPKFPDSLKKIGDFAYAGATSITEIVLPEGLTMLGSKEPEQNLFFGQVDQWGNYIQSNVRGVFEGCTALEKAVLVADIDYLGGYLFNNCNKLNKVFFPLGLKSIGEKSFAGCDELEEVVFPFTLESIGDYAFEPSMSEGSISKLAIPDNVTSIGTGAFRYQPITRLTLGSGLECISPETFAYHHLKILEFSEGLKEIGERAFMANSNWNQTSISSVRLPLTLETIKENAFSCANISEMIIPDGIKDLPAGSCGAPALLTIGSGVKTIDKDAFSFDNLRTLRVKTITPPSLSDAFNITPSQNDNMTLVVNNGHLTAFSTNARWKQIDNIIEESSSDAVIYMTGEYPISEEIRTTTGLMPSNVSKMKVVGPLTSSDLRLIKENMVSLQSLDLSEVTNLTEIPAEQFKNSLLIDIKLPSSIEYIGAAAFAQCSLLQLDELPESVTEISSGAFSGSPRISISRLPSALKTIGYDAFAHCDGLRYVIGAPALENIMSEAFMGCSLLEVVDLSETALSGISDYTFSGCVSLEEVVLPETVKTIGNLAFSNTALRDIDFIANVAELGEGAFGNCRRLVSANLPKYVIRVSGNTFANCPRLITSSMSSGVESIGANVFNGDSKLANISCAAADAPEAETGAFDGIRLRYVSLTVPGLSYRPYLNAPQWGRFQSIQNKIPVTIYNGIDVSFVAETEYQDMLKEDELEEAALQSGAQPQLLSRSMERRSMQTRAASEGRIFASLFDGAQIQTGTEGTGTRIFINPEPGVDITSILYAGKEMISQYKDNSILLPAGTQGTLEIKTSMGYTTSVDEIPSYELDGPVEVFNLNGLKVADSTDNLPKGIYVVRQGSKVKKVVVK
ncbi:MAG: leucine-rich repeat domain-containing protein [Muribaculaceae bacterium]|nr:leucine-rich repeat domain-containing protein [Muribaculaceae bacterium]